MKFASGWVEGYAVDLAMSIDGAGSLQRQRCASCDKLI
jgi:hypothetical protein